eukprot:6348934-Alexandrium_andersonii.AAC.1
MAHPCAATAASAPSRRKWFSAPRKRPTPAAYAGAGRNPPATTTSLASAVSCWISRRANVSPTASASTGPAPSVAGWAANPSAPQFAKRGWRPRAFEGGKQVGLDTATAGDARGRRRDDGRFT